MLVVLIDQRKTLAPVANNNWPENRFSGRWSD
jgi:hypothetical protein